MEIGETDRRKLQVQIPWIPTTPLKPISRPVPIWTPGQENQLGSHFNGIPTCFEPSASAEANSRPHCRSDPAATAHDNAKTRVQISFDDISSSSNGIAEMLAQSHAPSAYSNATHDRFFENQFVPTFSSQFDPTYTILGHRHLSYEQPLINTIHDNYQDHHGTSYLAYYSKTLPHIPPPTSDNAITEETRPDAATQINMKERGEEGEENNAPVTKCNYPRNQLYDAVIEVPDASTPCKENHNHNKETSHDIDLNQTPQPKPPRRRKHRPKVITEGKPKRTTKQVTPKPVQSKENPTSKRKPRRKGLTPTSTPQTEVTEEWTKAPMPESAKKTCRRSLNFDIGDQRMEYRENAAMHFGREIGVVTEETQALNNCVSTQGDMLAPSTHLSKSNSPGAKPNANYNKNSSTRSWMIAQDGHENSAKILSKSAAQSSPYDYNSSNRKILTKESGLLTGSKRKHSVIDHADNSNFNLVGAQYNAVQAYCQKYWVKFPNVQKKKRSEKGRISNTSYTSSLTATKNVLLPTCLQGDARSHSYASSPNCWTSGTEYNAVGVPDINTASNRAIHDKPQLLECNFSLGQRPTKRRSRVPTRTHDCASRNIISNHDTKLEHTATQTGTSDRQTSGDAERPQTCIEALAAEMRGSHTKKKRTKKKVSVEEMWRKIHTVDALTERFRHLNIYGEARELVLLGQNALVPYNHQNQKNKGLLHEYSAIVPFEGPFDPIKRQRPRPKVDLDEETNTVWKLLMLDINSHGIDGTDEDKARWWEEERSVFRGRADSFIARMHLVQGINHQ